MTQSRTLPRVVAEYARRGWPVLPLHTPRRTGDEPSCSCRAGINCRHVGKHPVGKLVRRGVLDASADVERVAEWFARCSNANVGIATGRASGIVVLDLDPRNGGEGVLADLVASHGKLPETFTVATGGGGKHFYFACPDGHRMLRPPGIGIELLGDGGCVVAPPSIHKSGRRYNVERDVPLALMPSWLVPALERLGNRDWEAGRSNRQLKQRGSARETLPDQHTDPCFHSDRVPEAVALRARVLRLVVKGPGQFDHRTLALARLLKVDAGLSLADTRALWREWFELSRPNTSHKNEREAWAKFERAFCRARVSLDARSLEAAFERSKRRPLPAEAERFRTPERRALVTLLAELQRARPAKPFVLACRDAAALIGLTHHAAWKALTRMEYLGLVRCTHRGTSGPSATGDANRYLWLGSIPELSSEHHAEEPTCTNRTAPVESSR